MPTKDWDQSEKYMAWLSKFATSPLNIKSQSKTGLESKTADKFRVQRKSGLIGQG